MNRNRFTQMRSMDRGQEPGLQQILQPSATGQLPAQGGVGNQAQQTVRRKTTYTRTELLLRGLPTTQNPRRSPRRAGAYAHNNNTAQPAAGPQTPHPTVGQGQGPGQGNNVGNTNAKRSYLPQRVTRLQQMAADRNPNPRMRPENDTKPEPAQNKATPRQPNTPHASDCSIPGPRVVMGHPTIRPEGCFIPVLDRSRNRQQQEQRQQEQQRQQERKDLPVLSDTSRTSSPAERHKIIKPAKPNIRLPVDRDRDQNKSFVYLCKPVKKVKELLTARELRHSCEHLELAGFGEEKEVQSQLQKTNSEALLHSKAVEQGLELSSITEMSIDSTSSSASQLQLSLQHRQLLQEEPPIGSTQERLESQLTEVRQRQRYLCQKEQREMEMNMVCQNLPTLQHEIRLLQELSEKLETTLRVSNTSKQKTSYDLERQSSTIFYTPRTGPMLYEEQPLVRLGYVRKEHVAKITKRAGILATVLNVGVVQEFRIETKTLNEIKATDESQCFYLPAQPPRQDHLAIRDVPEANPPPLQCTNIRMLRENPGVLLQQLRRGSGSGGSGGSSGSFNLLDHDMFMFLNSLAKQSADGDGILYSRLAVGLPAQEFSPGYQAAQLDELPSMRSCTQVNSTTQTEESVSENENLHPSIPDLVKAKKPKKKVIKKVQKQQQQLPVLGATRKTRVIKTSPIQSNVEPKVRMKLFKTVLVGLVQVGIFLILIMAFIYPDVTC